MFIACVSPSDLSAEESLSTLRYAERARSIKNKPVLNVDPATEIIQKLKEEILVLRRRLAEKFPRYFLIEDVIFENLATRKKIPSKCYN